MKRTRRNDYYSVSKSAFFSYMEVRFLLDFYLPLIGADGLSCYLRLQEEKSSEEGDVQSFDRLLNYLKLSAGEFEAAMNALEAVGLVRTYLSEGEESSFFMFVLSSPLSPTDFASDPLLSGTLRKYMGDEGMAALEERYKPIDVKKDDMKEISTSFSTYFSPDLDQGYYAADELQVKGKKSPALKTDFDRGLFQQFFRDNGEEPTWVLEEDLLFIERVATLYGFDEASTGSFAMESYYFDKGRKAFARNKFTKECEKNARFTYFRQEKGAKSQISGQTKRAQNLRLMDDVSPTFYLSRRQGGHAVAPADQNLLRKLALVYGLPNPVINAVITFCLEKCENALIPAYVEKIAGSVQRAGLKTARDTMEYLIAGEKKAKKPANKPEKSAKPSQKTENSPENKEVEIEDEDAEFEELMRKAKLAEEGDRH